MNKLVIFSHYDARNCIADYVVYYIDGLRAASCDVVFVSDCQLKLKEQDKIAEKTLVIITGKHGEYDFGSYKRGYAYASINHLLDVYEELIFCNDSCFAPIFPFSGMFDQMQSIACDFWGITYSTFGFHEDKGCLVKSTVGHLQSYFILFKKTVFNSSCFKDFLSTIKKEENKMYVILNYELRITKMLEDAGYISGRFIPEYVVFNDDLSVFELWDELIFHYHSPFLKYQAISLYKADFFRLKCLYPVDLIKKNIICRFGFFEYLCFINIWFCPLLTIVVIQMKYFKKQYRRALRWIKK